MTRGNIVAAGLIRQEVPIDDRTGTHKFETLLSLETHEYLQDPAKRGTHGTSAPAVGRTLIEQRPFAPGAEPRWAQVGPNAPVNPPRVSHWRDLLVPIRSHSEL